MNGSIDPILQENTQAHTRRCLPRTTTSTHPAATQQWLMDDKTYGCQGTNHRKKEQERVKQAPDGTTELR